MKLQKVRAWLNEASYDGALEERLVYPAVVIEDTFVVGADGPVPVTNTGNWPVVAGGRPAILCL